jgi:arylsulfatase A-like enzyme
VKLDDEPSGIGRMTGERSEHVLDRKVHCSEARMHQQVTTSAAAEISGNTGRAGRQRLGISKAGKKQLDDNVGYVLKKLSSMGRLDNTIILVTTASGA